MGIDKILSNAFNAKPLQKHIDKCIHEPKYLTRTLLLTSVSKDVFAYALRVHNTQQNQEIPEDKRNYVAKMDAVTGVTTAVVQIGIGLLVSNNKVQNFITDKLFKPIADNAKAMKSAKTAFSALSTMIVATLFAKRILVPLIASKLTSSPLLENKKEKQAPTNNATPSNTTAPKRFKPLT